MSDDSADRILKKQTYDTVTDIGKNENIRQDLLTPSRVKIYFESPTENRRCTHRNVTVGILATFALIVLVSSLVLLFTYVGWSEGQTNAIASKRNETNGHSLIKNVSTLHRLREELGEQVKFEMKYLDSRMDFFETQFINETILIQPKTVPQIQAVVKAANRLELKVRVIGLAGSWSPLWSEYGQILIDLQHLQRPAGDRMTFHPAVQEDEDATISSVASALVFELYDFMERHNVTWLSGIGYSGATLAGLFSTASHGEGIKETTLSEYLVGVKLVDSNGQLRSYNIHEHSKQMQALQCCLGMCGIFYDVTVKVYPAAVTRQRHRFWRVRDYIHNPENLNTILRDNIGVRMGWAPYSGATTSEWRYAGIHSKLPKSWRTDNDLMWIKLTDDSKEYEDYTLDPPYAYPPPRRNSRDVIKNMTYHDTTLTRVTTNAESESGANATSKPNATPAPPPKHWLQDAAAAAKSGIEKYFIRKNATYHRSASALKLGSIERIHKPIYGMGFISPENENFTMTDKMAKIVFSIIEEEMHQKGVISVIEVLFRWLRTSDSKCFLCPNNYPTSYGPYVVVTEILGMPGFPFNDFSKKFALETMREVPDARPHWAKMYSKVPGIIPHIRKTYHDNLEQFKRVRQNERWDPNDMFTNKLTRDIMYGDR
ncbi:unnamed protein product [Owenia fusiformis]|uniref:Uncharacterized protein n=1 Tax=Owenia fusiformis TaxID=6347 RepID=A0A8J1TUJ9_OWEFU|nr:unnamed protein product [Owenia fusiformis]